MSKSATTIQTYNFKEIEEVLDKALKKVGGQGEKDICRYIPMNSGGHLHHFTLKKMKKKQPSELVALLDQYILKASHPTKITPKKRAPRGSRKLLDKVILSKTHLERMIDMARLAGDQEMVAILSPKKSLAKCKRELISSIRHDRVNTNLWKDYVDVLNYQQKIEKGAL